MVFIFFMMVFRWFINMYKSYKGSLVTPPPLKEAWKKQHQTAVGAGAVEVAAADADDPCKASGFSQCLLEGKNVFIGNWHWGCNDLFKVIFSTIWNKQIQVMMLWLTRVTSPITPTLEVKLTIKVE